jgi:4'-phosphopantetheinyl transferase EntD
MPRFSTAIKLLQQKLPGLAGFALLPDAILSQEDSLYLQAQQCCPAKGSFKRKEEFVRGRYCLLRSLQSLGYEDWKENKDLYTSSQAPQLPPGYLGSISHCENATVALAAKQSSLFHGLGVDIETSTRHIRKGFLERITSIEEREYLRKALLVCEQHPESFPDSFPLNEDERAIAIFSAKEAAYKALSSSMQEKIQIFAISISNLKAKENMFGFLATARLTEEEVTLEGCFWKDSAFILSFAKR